MSKGCWAVWGIEDMWWRWEMWGGESYGFLVSIIWCVRVYHRHPIEYFLYYSILYASLTYFFSSYRLLINFTGMWNLVTRYVSFSYYEPHCLSPFSIDIDTWQLLSERALPCSWPPFWSIIISLDFLISSSFSALPITYLGWWCPSRLWTT